MAPRCCAYLVTRATPIWSAFGVSTDRVSKQRTSNQSHVGDRAACHGKFALHRQRLALLLISRIRLPWVTIPRRPDPGHGGEESIEVGVEDDALIRDVATGIDKLD